MPAADLTDFIDAPYQLALIHTLNKDIKRAKEKLEKIRQDDKKAKRRSLPRGVDRAMVE